MEVMNGLNCSAIPIIVTISYVIGELYKAVFRSQGAKRLIPIILALVGAVLGASIYFTAPQIISAGTVWDAILTGIVCGESATGTNQIIKQLFVKGDGKDEK